MENFFQSHVFLLENTDLMVRRSLMDKINWKQRMIGIRGTRGIGKTIFLLQYAKERFDPNARECLYIDMNGFYFRGCGLVDFAEAFVENGGRVLLIDQVYKQPNWQEDLYTCYQRFPSLRIVYTTSSIGYPHESSYKINEIQTMYDLHGFSLREYINWKTNDDLAPIPIERIFTDLEQVQREILTRVKPWDYFSAYLRGGAYCALLEHGNFIDALLKAVNMIIDVDLPFIKDIDLKRIICLKELLYLLAIRNNATLNISKLAEAVGTSRATVSKYIQYMEEARLLRQIYLDGKEGRKKPVHVFLQNTNLMYTLLMGTPVEQRLIETFFLNAVGRYHTIRKNRHADTYIIEGREVRVCRSSVKTKPNTPFFYAKSGTEVGRGNVIPLWLFGYIY